LVNSPIHDIIHLVLGLIDDALDAGATDFRISSEGAWSVSVQDNGCGIRDFAKLTDHYYSSRNLDSPANPALTNSRSQDSSWQKFAALARDWSSRSRIAAEGTR
jgi:hypothetical protein